MATDPHLRLHGHWDRQNAYTERNNLYPAPPPNTWIRYQCWSTIMLWEPKSRLKAMKYQHDVHSDWGLYHVGNKLLCVTQVFFLQVFYICIYTRQRLLTKAKTCGNIMDSIIVNDCSSYSVFLLVYHNGMSPIKINSRSQNLTWRYRGSNAAEINETVMQTHHACTTAQFLWKHKKWWDINKNWGYQWLDEKARWGKINKTI
jgi:hypothetical protein